MSKVIICGVNKVMTEPLRQVSSCLSPLLKVFELEPALREWYESQEDITPIINEALRQYRTQHCLLEKEGWKYQVKAKYRLHVIAKDRVEYVCDLSFDEFTEAEAFLHRFLVYESGGEWITQNRMVFTNTADEDE